MRTTTFLGGLAVAAAALLSPHMSLAEEEAEESEAPVQAAEYLGTERYALVIGIDDYTADGLPDLQGRESSARGVLSVLVDLHVGGIPEANTQLLLGAEATTAKVRAALEGLQSVPPEATVFVYFAGHGAGKGEDAYWVTQDAQEDDLAGTAVADAEVRRLLGQIPAARVLLMMDCVHAPGLVGANSTREDDAAVLARYHDTGYATLGAAASKEHPFDPKEAELSVFAHYVVEALSGDGDEDASGVADLGELAAYVSRRVRAEARKRKGLERPVVDLQGVPEPSRFLLTIEQESLQERFLEEEQPQIQRRERLAAVQALRSEERITVEQADLGRLLLGTLEEGFEPKELEQRTMFVDLAERRLLPEHLAGVLTAIRRADRRTLVVPDEFKTIQAAIDAASAGDTVFVKAGTYDERLVFKTGLHLRGQGREQTVVRMVPGEPEILLAQDCAWGVIEGLQFDGTGGTELEGWSPDGVHLKRSSLRVIECLAHSCLGGGLYASGAGNRPYVRACTFEKNKQDGLCFSEAEGGVILECICRSNGAVGIQVRQSVTAVTIQDCQCEFDAQAGIGVCGGATAILRGNHCRSNGGHGILAWDKGTSVTLVDNTCSLNEIYGIYVVQRATAVANGNDCSRNKESGLVVSGSGSRATFVENRCLDNDHSDKGFKCGIVICDGASGEATSNTCNDNLCGIFVNGSGTSASLTDNICRRNDVSGIDIADSATGQATGNHCDENEHGIRVARAEVTLTGNALRRNKTHGISIGTRAVAEVSDNRCEENGQAGIHVTDMGTRAELLKNTCASNGSHGIQFARGAGGTADGNQCSENKAFGIVAFDSGTRPIFRRNRCTNNVGAGIGKQEGAAPVIETNNIQSGNGG